ncbi:Synaptic glycoprotein SC2, partial [Giardia duodenalis]
VSCSFEILVCEHGSHRGSRRGGAQGRCNKRQEHGSDAEERPGVTECRDERVQDGRCTRAPATAHAGPRLEARQTDSDGLTAVAHPSNKTVPASSSRRVLRCPRGPRERRVQGGERRGVCDAQRGGEKRTDSRDMYNRY